MKKDHDIDLRGHHLKLVFSFHFIKNSEKKIWEIAARDHGEKHADNFINTLKKITGSDIKVKIIATVDDICKTCDKKETKHCIEVGNDKDVAFYYGFSVNKIYSSNYILSKLALFVPTS